MAHLAECLQGLRHWRLDRLPTCAVWVVAHRDGRGIGRGLEARNIQLDQTACSRPGHVSLTEGIRSVFSEPIQRRSSHCVHESPIGTPRVHNVPGEVPLNLCQAQCADRRALRMGLSPYCFCDRMVFLVASQDESSPDINVIMHNQWFVNMVDGTSKRTSRQILQDTIIVGYPFRCQICEIH
jgi:hypothetical protein